MGAKNTKTLLMQLIAGGFDRVVVLQGHPFLTALGGAVKGAHPPLKAHHMGFKHSHSITATQDRRKVVGFLYPFQQHREICHAAVEHCL